MGDQRKDHIQWIKDSVGLLADASQTAAGPVREQLAKLAEEYRGYGEEEKEAIRRIMEDSFEPNDRIYLFSAYVQMGLDEFKEGILDAALEGDFDAFAGIMMEWQMAAMQIRDYRKRRKLRRENVRRLEQCLGGRREYLPIKGRNKGRVVIMTEQVLSTRHSPTKIVLEFAYSLQEEMGYEVLLFICPSDGSLPQELWANGHSVANSIEGWRDAPVRVGYRGAVFSGYQVSLGRSRLKEYQMMLDLIHAYNPYFVLAAGINNPIADVVGKFTTEAFLAMAVNCPISEGEILLRLGRKGAEEEAGYEKEISEGQRQVFLKRRLPVVLDGESRPHTRMEHGLPDGKFLAAIVGNRLDMEITEEFAGSMKEALMRFPDVAFVVIGDVGRLKEAFGEESGRGRVYFLGYCKDLVGTYAAVDLYLNPPRSGGGWSAMMALAAGIPAVTLPECDVAYNVGDAFTVQDEAELWEVFGRYVNDEGFYRQKALEARLEAEKNASGAMTGCVSEIVGEVVNILEGEV